MAKRIPYKRISLTAAPSARLLSRTRKATRWRAGIPMRHMRTALTSVRRSQRISPCTPSGIRHKPTVIPLSMWMQTARRLRKLSPSPARRTQPSSHRPRKLPTTSSTMHKVRACCSTRTTKRSYLSTGTSAHTATPCSTCLRTLQRRCSRIRLCRMSAAASSPKTRSM